MLNFLKKEIFLKKKKHLYAIGKIIFLKKNKKIKKQILKYLNLNKNIALSNYKLSPYGNSSKKTLKNLKINYKINTIFGTNINQTFSFVFNNVSDIGITSLSQIKCKTHIKNSYKKIPKYLYPKINQHMIIINHQSKEKLENIFLKYIKTKKIKNTIKKQGYKNN